MLLGTTAYCAPEQLRVPISTGERPVRTRVHGVQLADRLRALSAFQSAVVITQQPVRATPHIK